MAAVPIGGRALPIYIEVHPLKKLGNAAIEKRFLRALKAIVPTECRSVIVSDAGFKGPFFQAVLDQGWDFLGRIRGTTKAISSVGETISKEQFYARASITPIELGPFGLFVKQQIPCRLVLVRKRRRPGRKRPPPACKEEREMRQAALDPWLLATSMSDGDAASVVGIYARRMQIEETFRDTKNHRFGWSLGDVRLSTPQRTAVLLTLAALAFSSSRSSAWPPSDVAPTAPIKPIPKNGASFPSSSSPQRSCEETRSTLAPSTTYLARLPSSPRGSPSDELSWGSFRGGRGLGRGVRRLY